MRNRSWHRFAMGLMLETGRRPLIRGWQFGRRCAPTAEPAPKINRWYYQEKNNRDHSQHQPDEPKHDLQGGVEAVSESSRSGSFSLWEQAFCMPSRDSYFKRSAAGGRNQTGRFSPRAARAERSAFSWIYLQQWLRGPVMDRSEPRAKQAGMMNSIVSHPHSLSAAALNTC